ncbi:hypothetical protein POTOM_024600 [Populus tomentosa]|uniref:BED-type domain-containing protein n=1 Tax=Populus tomentosa TaxID=118781 RepID=A0A8X7ZTM5_POPTO|nr:hypothetical protein POTOM_024600 [Populus tomentosa]
MRRKKDVGWKHCEMLKNEKRVQIKCNYCAKLFKGGGIHRFKEHLAGRNSGGVPSCTRVPSDVRDLMEQHLSPIVVRQRKKRKSKREKLDDVDSPPGGEDVYIFADYSDDMITPLRAVAACNLAEVNSDFLLDGEGTSKGNLGTRKSAIAVAASDDADAFIAMGSETADNPIHVIWGRFLYDIGASLDAMDSNFSQPLIDTVAYGRPGIAAPSHQDLRGRILKSLVEEQPGGLAMVDIITNRSFWSSCILIIRLTSPLLQVLVIVSSEKRAAMGYVFSGIYRAKETIKKELVKREDYMVYWNIIDHRWEQQWQTPLHAAGFFFNPKFFYSIEGDMHNKILSRMFDCIERLVPDTEVQDKIVKELTLYKNAEGDLGKKLAIRARGTLLPVGYISFSSILLGTDFEIYHGILADWWSIYGGSCPNLARLAVRILSQTCSAIGCSHNHIPFEKVHRTRNFLQRQRLTDLVFVQYNLRLRQMVDGNKKQIPEDPISFDDVSLVEDWITQNELCLEDSGSSDWMSLVPRSVYTMPLAPSTDESEDVASGNCLAMLKNVSSQLLFLIKLNALVCMQGLMILRYLMDRRMFKMRNGDDEVNHGEFILMAGYVFHHMLTLEKERRAKSAHGVTPWLPFHGNLLIILLSWL